MAHYGVRPQAINAGKGHENGDVEQSHHRFKRGWNRLCFCVAAGTFRTGKRMRHFSTICVSRRNAKRKERFEEEKKQLRPLPARRLESFRHQKVRVQSGSTISVERNIYSVPARLIGERVQVPIYAESIEVWYGQRKEEVLPRLRGRYKHHINYRHVIEWLVRKPGRLRGIAIGRRCFRRADFAWPTIIWRRRRRDVRFGNTWGFWIWPRSRARWKSMRRYVACSMGGGVSLAAVEALVKEGMAPAPGDGGVRGTDQPIGI